MSRATHDAVSGAPMKTRTNTTRPASIAASTSARPILESISSRFRSRWGDGCRSDYIPSKLIQNRHNKLLHKSMIHSLVPTFAPEADLRTGKPDRTTEGVVQNLPFSGYTGVRKAPACEGRIATGRVSCVGGCAPPRGSSLLGLKRSQAQQGEPVWMA